MILFYLNSWLILQCVDGKCLFLLLSFTFVTYLFQVNKIEIHYAKTAKKMDMKKLKQSMWSLLTDFPQVDVEVSRHGGAGVKGSTTSPGARQGWWVGSCRYPGLQDPECQHRIHHSKAPGWHHTWEVNRGCEQVTYKVIEIVTWDITQPCCWSKRQAMKRCLPCFQIAAWWLNGFTAGTI